MNMAPNGDQAPQDSKALLMSLSTIQMFQLGIGFSIVAIGAMFWYLMHTGSFAGEERASSGLMVGVVSLVTLVLMCLLYSLAYAVPRRILRGRIRRLLQTQENDPNEGLDPASLEGLHPGLRVRALPSAAHARFPCVLWACGLPGQFHVRSDGEISTSLAERLAGRGVSGVRDRFLSDARAGAADSPGPG